MCLLGSRTENKFWAKELNKMVPHPSCCQSEVQDQPNCISNKFRMGMNPDGKLPGGPPSGPEIPAVCQALNPEAEEKRYRRKGESSLFQNDSSSPSGKLIKTQLMSMQKRTDK